MLAFQLARFKVNATPPNGHPLCGGWIRPAECVDDPLWLRGIVLLGADQPIVLASLDWTGVQNESHRLWTEALAEAARTTPDRVALHCVHQHNAPFVDREANALLRKLHASPLLQDDTFVDGLVRRSAEEVRASLSTAKPVDRVESGQSVVVEVASNRRILGPDGRVKIVRYSATRDPAARAAPEGTIDPVLRSVGFCHGDRPLARLYYYTTHPMSYYGDGRVTSDFVGLARERRDREEPETLHVYFTGCAGNITAGKYNDGSPGTRAILADRVHTAMVGADAQARERTAPLESMVWKTSAFLFRPREDLDLGRLTARLEGPEQSVSARNHLAMTCGWLKRCAAGQPVVLSRLDLSQGASILHLPAETFVEYQLEAQRVHPERFLATAAYGEGGPWYIPLERSFREGGYEPTAAHVSVRTEPDYRRAIADLLRA
ncbi:MAG: hypothetical protein U0790_21895 [Isosphaeraceae bacterium]